MPKPLLLLPPLHQRIESDLASPAPTRTMLRVEVESIGCLKEQGISGKVASNHPDIVLKLLLQVLSQLHL